MIRHWVFNESDKKKSRTYHLVIPSKLIVHPQRYRPSEANINYTFDKLYATDALFLIHLYQEISVHIYIYIHSNSTYERHINNFKKKDNLLHFQL